MTDAPDYIRKASHVIEVINLGEEEKKVVQALEKAQAIIDAECSSAFFDGKDEGKDERSVEIAFSMLQDGDALEKIARNTGLSLEQVRQLQSQPTLASLAANK